MTSDAAGYFDAAAVRYDEGYDERGIAGRTLRARMTAALRLLGEARGEVLDVGMGAGRLCAELDRRGFEVTGVDLSERMVDLARARLPQLADRLQVARAERLPFPDSSFDAVVVTGVLEYTDDLSGSLGEIRRVLRPGGLAVVAFPNYLAPAILWRRRVLYPAVRAVKRLVPFGRPAPYSEIPHPLSPGRFERLLGEAGFRIEAIARIPSRLLPRQLVYAVRVSS